MDALKLTFVNGETIQFQFGVDSTLKIETPDGVNGVQNGAWGEITDVAYVKDAGEVVATTVVAGPTETAAPDTTVEPPADPSLFQKVEEKFGIGHAAFDPAAHVSTSPATSSPAFAPPTGDLPAVVPATVEQAVVAAQSAVDTALVGDAPDSVSHLAQAQADVAAALAVYPDSVELQDAQAQLGEIATTGA